MKTNWLKWGNDANETSRTGPAIGLLALSGSVVALLSAVAYSARPEIKGNLALEADRAAAAAVLAEAFDAEPVLQRAAARRAAEILGDDSQVGRQLAEAVGEASQAALSETLRATHKTLTFRPLVEAELPLGFPAPGPLGEIRIKDYPAYRMAVSDSGGAAFWTLFRHIKRNEIAMTAPVEMSFGPADAARPAEQSMAFLYGSTALGQTGTEGNVEVVDAAPMTVVSLGLAGDRSMSRIETARDRLLAWLAADGRFEASGPMRVLGYNSPFVARDQRYWEVQIPVQPRAGDEAA